METQNFLKRKGFLHQKQQEGQWGKNWSDCWVWKLRGCRLSPRAVSAEHCRKKEEGRTQQVKEWMGCEEVSDKSEQPGKEGETYEA